MEHLQFACPQKETAERYAMNRLSPGAAQAFEQHLSGCAHCATTVEFADEFVSMVSKYGPNLPSETIF